jgi:hypothetical protein
VHPQRAWVEAGVVQGVGEWMRRDGQAVDGADEEAGGVARGWLVL